MVINHCTLTKQSCMIHHFNQRVTADVKMYHTCLYVECTLTYDHNCTQFWRSVSAAGHGNLILKQLTRPTRVRSPDPNRHLCFQTNSESYHRVWCKKNAKIFLPVAQRLLQLEIQTTHFLKADILNFWKLS